MPDQDQELVHTSSPTLLVYFTFTNNRTYLRHLARFLREGFDADSFQPRIHELADLIRSDVYADPNKQYSNADFEQSLDTDLGGGGGGPGGGLSYGLTAFVQQRAAFLDTHLDGFASRSDLQLNELMSANTSTVADSQGDHHPWVEIYNLGPGAVNFFNVFLTDDMAQPSKWQLPEGVIDDGEFRVLWMDGEPTEGTDHSTFALNAAGGDLHLYKRSGGTYTLIDSVSYPALGDGVSWGRSQEESADWERNAGPTPGDVNLRSFPDLEGVLFINEFMADNQAGISDEASEFDDWIELYNAGTEALDLGGLFLTDDLLAPTVRRIPTCPTAASPTVAPSSTTLSRRHLVPVTAAAFRG
jgi:hypothetical protein